MIPTIIISVITFILIILSILFFPHLKIGKIQLDTYWIIASFGAIILLSFNLTPIKEVFSQMTANTPVNPLKILVLFFSMTILSIFLDEFGLFRYLASLAAKHGHSSQYSLFFILYGLTSLLTVFTSNDVVILTITPFICFFAKRTKINPIPYLIAEFAGANTWSLMFVIGNPTNIYLATSAGINFMNYLKVMWLPTIAAGLVEIGIIFLLFRRKLKQPLSIDEDDQGYVIPSKVDLFIGLAHLFVCLVFLVISSYIGIEMWIISSICALSLLIITLIIRLITRQYWSFITNSLKRLPYQLIPFFLSMFIIVVGINYQGITQKMSEILGSKQPILVYGYSSFVVSNLINNIPMSILFSKLEMNLIGTTYTQAVYASIIGSNIGAFLTPIGALAGIMFSHLVNEQHIKMSFIDFAKYGVITAIPTISVCLLTLMLVVR